MDSVERTDQLEHQEMLVPLDYQDSSELAVPKEPRVFQEILELLDQKVCPEIKDHRESKELKV